MGSDGNGSGIEPYLRKVEKSPDSAVAHYNLGLAYTQRGRVDGAERHYRKAVELDPDLVEAWVNLGGALLLKWDFKGAIAANREALERKELLLAHYNIGQASLYLRDAEGVVRSNRRVVQMDPKHAAGHYFLAVGLLAIGRLDDARTALSRAKLLGHSPAPEFVRALQTAEQARNRDTNPKLVTEIGASAPADTERKE